MNDHHFAPTICLDRQTDRLADRQTFCVFGVEWSGVGWREVQASYCHDKGMNLQVIYYK